MTTLCLLLLCHFRRFFFFFFFNDTATTEIYTLSLHDALPILGPFIAFFRAHGWLALVMLAAISLYRLPDFIDRKSTRLNSSHLVISYAVFCLKKKKDDETSACGNPQTNRFT